MNIKLLSEKEVDVKYLTAVMGVRYWDDAEVNGVQCDADSPDIPFVSENKQAWQITVDLDTGVVLDWPQGVAVTTHFKVCDDGEYTLKDQNNKQIAKYDGYVPSILDPDNDGFGDYVILDIDGNGKIKRFNPDPQKIIEDFCNE